MILEVGTQWELDPTSPGGERVRVTIQKVTRASVWVNYGGRFWSSMPWYRFFVELNAEPVGLLRGTADEAVKMVIREMRS